ncbi:MAG: hypothetical protein JRJ87_16280 [Deltaproteobacteria bacterium]|nr:hypothetical protein [Deltaproteobacteria bacterium]
MESGRSRIFDAALQINRFVYGFRHGQIATPEDIDVYVLDCRFVLQGK